MEQITLSIPIPKLMLPFFGGIFLGGMAWETMQVEAKKIYAQAYHVIYEMATDEQRQEMDDAAELLFGKNAKEAMKELFQMLNDIIQKS